MDKGMIIKRLREQKGLSQVELAKKIGVSKQTLYKYEKGIVTNIPSDKIEALAKALETTPEVLMGWAELPTTTLEFHMPPIPEEAVKSFEKEIRKKEELKRLSESVNKNYKDESAPTAVYYTNPETAKIAQEMFDDPQMRSLFHMKRTMEPEKFQAHYDMMKKLYEMEHPEDSDDFSGC